MTSPRSLGFLLVGAGIAALIGCGGGTGLGTGDNSNDNNTNQGSQDGGTGADGQTPQDSGPGPDGAVGPCIPGTDPCCDPDGTPCDHGCDGTSCYPDCDPATDSCCEDDGTACAHGCDGTSCYPQCDPSTDLCCNPDGTLSAGSHGLCELGGPLDPACDPCVAAVCQVDEYCCSNEWDLLCFDAVLAECGQDCSTGVIGCDDQYGGVTNYVGCAQGGGTCTFSTSTISSSCATKCAGAGGECVDAYNNSGTCGLAERTGCSHTGYGTEICICSRGCGAGAPCTPPATCQSGQCI